MAVAQLERAVDFLEQAGSSPERVRETRAKLVEVLQSVGQVEKAHLVLSKMAESDPSLRGRVNLAAKEVRKKANGLLVESSSARKKGDYLLAVSRAEEAYQLYKDFKGSPGQMAGALEAAARGQLAQERTPAAESHLRQAQKLQWTRRRAELLAGLAPHTASVHTRSGSRPVKRPTMGAPSSVPQAERPKRESYPVSDSWQRPEPAKSVPMEEETRAPRQTTELPSVTAPAEAPTPGPYAQDGLTSDRPGDNGVLESYGNSHYKPASSVPGYR